MEKLRLNESQDYAIRTLMERDEFKADPGAAVERHVKQLSNGERWPGFFRALGSLSVNEFCRAIYTEYEVIEPPQTIVVEEHMRKKLLSSFDAKPSDGYDTGMNAGIQLALDVLGVRVVGITE